MTNTEILNHLQSKLRDCQAKAQSHFHSYNLPTPPIKFRQMGRCAGQATWKFTKDQFGRFQNTPELSSLEIIINPDYCQNGHWEDMLNNTLPHEYAHILAIFLYGRRLGGGHGRGWKNCMNVLGLKPERCHNYSTEGVKVRKTVQFEYTCSCNQLFYLGKKRHNKIQVGTLLRSGKLHKSTYRCPKCRSPLTFTGKSGVGIRG